MGKVCKLFAVLILVFFLTGCSGVDTNLSSLSCGYTSTNKNASAIFTIGGFDIRGINSTQLSLQRIQVKETGKTDPLYSYEMDTNGIMSAQEIIANYDRPLGTEYFMTAHFMNLADEFKDIVNSNSESEHLKLCVEYIVFGYKVESNKLVRDFWIADSEKLDNVINVMREEGWEDDEMYIFKRSWGVIDGVETVVDRTNEAIDDAEDASSIVNDPNSTETEKEQAQEDLKKYEGYIDAGNYVAEGIGIDDEIDDYEFETNDYVFTDTVNSTSLCYTGNYSPETCAYYLGNAEDNNEFCPAYWLNYVFQIVKYVSVILVIVLDMIDLASAIAKDGIEPKLVKKCVMRLVIVIVILLLPTLINSVGQLFGLDGLLCGIK